MKLIITLGICILTLGVESQTYFGQNQQYDDQFTAKNRAVYPANKAQSITPYYNYTGSVNNVNPSQSVQFRSNIQEDNPKVIDRDSYLQAISRNDNTPNQQLPNRQDAAYDANRIHFIEPSVELVPPPFGENPTSHYYSKQQNNNALTTPVPESFDNVQQSAASEPDDTILNNVTVAVSNFGLRLMKTASQMKSGNVIVSPTSVATVLSLLQQGATGQAQEQITRLLQITPETSKNVYSTIAAHMQKRNSRNILSIANSIFVSDAFELNDVFKRLAIRNFWSEVSATNFASPSEAIQKINTWVASKTNNKITNLLAPGAVNPTTQLVLLNAVYFKGLWETKFKPERTEPDTFTLSNGDKKSVPFMHIRHTFQSGYDLNTRAVVAILPFEGHQYSLILILPKKSDNVANVLSTLTVEQLLRYRNFDEHEITVHLPKFTLKTNIDLNPVLRNMGVTNIFGSRSELTGIGLYRTFPPQISSAVHSGFLSIDEQGVTAAASTAFAAIALSYDDSSISFRADRPFIAILWDSQLSIPIFISKIEDPS